MTRVQVLLGGTIVVLVALLALLVVERPAVDSRGVSGGPAATAGPRAATPTAAPAGPVRSTPTRARATTSPSNPSLTRGDRWELVPMPTLNPYNDAVIKDATTSSRPLRVCRDWGTTSCRAGSPTGVLRPGQDTSTALGWRDADGYDAGRGWVKQHGCFRCTVTITVR